MPSLFSFRRNRAAVLSLTAGCDWNHNSSAGIPSAGARVPPREISQAKMLRPFDRLHILRPFKRRWVGTTQLAHAALHLADRFVFMVGHPCLQLPFDEMKLQAWMTDHEYESVRQMQGCMSQLRCADPSAFERAQYMQAVKGTQHLRLADLSRRHSRAS